MRLSPPGTHFTAESTEAMRIKSLAQGENILMLGFEPSTSVSKIDILTSRQICSNVYQWFGLLNKIRVLHPRWLFSWEWNAGYRIKCSGQADVRLLMSICRCMGCAEGTLFNVVNGDTGTNV